MSNTITHQSKSGAADVSALMHDVNDVFSKNTKAILGALGTIILVVAAGAFFMERKSGVEDHAKGQLFIAERTINEGLKKIAQASAPATPAKKDASAKDAKDAKTPEVDAESVAFKKLDVDAQLGDGVKALQAVSTEFPSTRAGHEARMKLGEIYFRHGEPQKAISWFEKAADAAPNSNEKIMALANLGYAQEASGKFNEAVQTFEKALNLGAEGVKGYVLLAMARCYKGLNDTAKARGAYDRIISELPNTESARNAEALKNSLE